MAPDEVRRLDNRDALLFLRGEFPVRDRKLDLMKAPGIQETPAGGAAPYSYDFGAKRRAARAAVSHPAYAGYALMTGQELESMIEKGDFPI